MTQLKPDQYNTSTYPCNGRLTLGSGSPIITVDQSAKSTLYFTPYLGNYIALYDGTSTWNTIKFVETSLNISTYTASKPYDIWGYNSSGSLVLDSTVWTNDTTRATALAYQDGVYVKSGSTTCRYLGSIYINSSGSNTSDIDTKRFVWNYYNRVSKKLKVTDSTDSWAYTTATWRSANNSVANRVEIIIGVSENFVDISTNIPSSNTSIVGRYSGIGLDITNDHSDDISIPQYGTTILPTHSEYKNYVGIGYHFLQWVEYSVASGTTTWYGDAGAPTLFQGGMIGQLLC